MMLDVITVEHVLGDQPYEQRKVVGVRDGRPKQAISLYTKFVLGRVW